MLLYFYTNANAVIIGKNQNPWKECSLTAMERDGVQLVRRITGGGAVFHDEGNLNFSFIAGEAIYDVQRQLGMIMSAVPSPMRGLPWPPTTTVGSSRSAQSLAKLSPSLAEL